MRELYVQHVELTLPQNNELFLASFSHLSLKRGACARFRAFASDVQPSRAIQGRNSVGFLLKAAITDLGK